ncbi:hypothetical protein PAMP_024740 [Pampus punctatissimus]
MDVRLKTQLEENGRNYQRALERIINKYSKVQYEDEAVEVDLNTTSMRNLVYLKFIKIYVQQLDFMDQDSELNKTSVSTRQFYVEDDGENKTLNTWQDKSWQILKCRKFYLLSYLRTTGMSGSDSSQLTVSSLDESQRNSPELELQPEDQDEELEMSLRSQGSSLVELYPGMISQIGRAWHRQHVSEAADSVLRRYRRWRQSNRSNLNNTFNITLRCANSNPEKMTGETLLKETLKSPLKRQFPGMSNRAAETAPLSPLHKVTILQDWHTHQQSPGRERGTLRREQHQPVLVMDFSSSSETSEPKRSSLNETFTVNQLSPPSFSQLGAQSSFYAVSPSQPHFPSARASLDMSLRLKRLPLSSHSTQTAGGSMYASETTGVRERSDIYGSPVRQSPLKARVMTRESLGRSSPLHAFSRSPKSDPVNYSRERMRSRSMATSLSSPPQKPVMPLKMHQPQESHHSFQSQLHSPRSVTAAGHHKLRRHLSFDSSLPQNRVFHPQKELDDDFAKLYHKFVCQSKSSNFNGPPCRMCARSSEASRGHSSSALAALALSPHRSVLRKRHRELDCDCHPQSKRSRDGYCTYSPGSKRYGKEILTQFIQQPSANARVPAAEVSGLGKHLL